MIKKLNKLFPQIHTHIPKIFFTVPVTVSLVKILKNSQLITIIILL